MSINSLVRAIAKTLVRECKNCHGAGEVLSTLMANSFIRTDCSHCADLRKALEEEE